MTTTLRIDTGFAVAAVEGDGNPNSYLSGEQVAFTAPILRKWFPVGMNLEDVRKYCERRHWECITLDNERT